MWCSTCTSTRTCTTAEKPNPTNTQVGEPHRVAGCLDDLAALEVPLLVGEFGNSHSSGAVAWQTIIERTNANHQGWAAPWLWFDDTEYPQLNMNETCWAINRVGKQAIADFRNSANPRQFFAELELPGD